MTFDEQREIDTIRHDSFRMSRLAYRRAAALVRRSGPGAAVALFEEVGRDAARLARDAERLLTEGQDDV
jgi:hypothetical protein